MSKKETAVILLCDSASGSYIPQRFAREISVACLSGIDGTVLTYLDESGPEAEFYWDEWQYVLDNAKLTLGGDEYTLYHDGDLWALCVDRMSAEERQSFGFGEVTP